MRATSFRSRGWAPLIVAVALALVLQVPLADAGPESLEGVTNFGRVTKLYFRGGRVTTKGVENLHAMGVRTIIDLTKHHDEEAAARRLGMTYYSFPLKGKKAPSDATVAAILRIITEAKEPVYAHCSGGKQRAGTIAALYRMRVQGWSPARAWEEEERYGFGSPTRHLALYQYAYCGRGPCAGPAPQSARPGAEGHDERDHKGHDDKHGGHHRHHGHHHHDDEDDDSSKSGWAEKVDPSWGVAAENAVIA